jgi:hypothetical protein
VSNTPILDREQPLPAVKKKIKTWQALLVGAAIGGLLALRDAYRAYNDTPPVEPPGLGVLLIFVAAFYFGVLVHELGHVIAGLSVGFELRSLAVGPLLLTKEARGWKLRFLARRILVGGLTAMAPKSSDRLVGRYLRFILGGPAASVVLLIIAFILTLISPTSSAVEALLYVSVFLTFMCCLPYTVRSQPTDAKGILLLTRKGPGAERFVAILYILALDAQQIEPHDWPPDLVEKLSIPSEDKTRLAASAYFSLAVALDSGDPERIAEAVEHGLSINPESGPDMQRAFQVAASCFQGVFRHNAPLAQAWLDSARSIKYTASRKDWDAKALASIALASGENDRAREHMARYLALVDQLPNSGILAAERARTVALLGRIEARSAV